MTIERLLELARENAHRSVELSKVAPDTFRSDVIALANAVHALAEAAEKIATLQGALR